LLFAVFQAWEESAGIISFPNIQFLASEVSKLLTKEIKKTLNAKPAEDARLAVRQLLWPKGEEEDGCLLLRSVYLLSQADSGTLWNLIKSGLPVALMQCLYLFFTFPLGKARDGGTQEEEDQVQEMFIQTMLNLYREEEGLEELLTTAELQSLIIATASRWDQCSLSWKASTGRVLRAISKAQTKTAVIYLQATECIKIVIQSLSLLADTLPASDLCEAVSIILCFVKDSYPISSALLLEFENNDGYQLLVKILLKWEGSPHSEGDCHLEEVLDILTYLTTCGKTELKVSGNITHPQLPHFDFEQTQSSGTTVKNLPPFQVLQSVFQKTSDLHLCRTILAALKTLWAWDPMNFFLLEWTLQPISQFTDIIPYKPPPIQVQLFQLVESVVRELSYTPHEILKKVEGLIKENSVPHCTLAALRCLHSIAKTDSLFTDIFRDSGLLGQLLAQLRKQAKILRKTGTEVSCLGILEQGTEKELTCAMLKMVATLVLGSVRNTVVLKDYGMVPYIKIFLDDECYRSDTLCILEQLSVINTEEYMSIIIGALCSSTQGELHLKRDLLKSLLRTLESPKSHPAFRTCSGFNGLLSLLSDMEGALQAPPAGLWAATGPGPILDLVLYTLQGIAAALHRDPVNSDFFQRNGLFEKLAEDLGALGCFWTREGQPEPVQLEKGRTFAELVSAAVCSAKPFPTWLRSCLRILGFLDRMVKGTLHMETCFAELKPAAEEPPGDVQEGPQDQQEEQLENKAAASDCRAWPDPEDRSEAGDCAIVHPGAVCVMVSLLPKLYMSEHPQLSQEIQCAVADHVQSLVKSEKSRQVMCTAGLLSTILSSCQHPLVLDGLPLIRIFEKLASQSIEPDVLRRFLWLGPPPPAVPRACSRPGKGVRDPVNGRGWRASCTGSAQAPTHLTPACWDNPKAPPPATQTTRAPWVPRGSARALQTAMSLISMTSPRNFQPHNTSLAPPFVEFDMSSEGYGCLFLPALSTVMGPNVEHSISGGVGVVGTRLFPPSGGLTLSSWFLVSKFCSARDAHPLRFLTVVRHMSRMEQECGCLAVSLSPVDRSLVISTEEVEFQPLDVMEPEAEVPNHSSAPSHVEFSCSKLVATGQWHHLTVTVAKEAKRNCLVSAYINGEILGSAKMQYIQPLPGSCVSMDPSSFVDVYGYIATPRLWKQESALAWRLGPTYLFEEPLSLQTVEVINKLGPRYFSNFQAVRLPANGHSKALQPTPLVAEERISFGINATCSITTTVQAIKSGYNEVDGRHIAKEMGIISRDSSTPVFLARNIAGHLAGPLRTIGAVAVGQFDGISTFSSSSFISLLGDGFCFFVCGRAVALHVYSHAVLGHGHSAPVYRCASCMTNTCQCMETVCGYRVLAYLLKRKTKLLNNRILQLVLSVAGTAELGVESSTIKNYDAFRYVLCNFELWSNAPENLDLTLFSHLVEILQPSSRDRCQNAKVAYQMQMVPKLVFLFNDTEISRSRVTVICTIFSHQLQGYFNTRDVLRIGLFLVYTLKPSSVDESQICPDGITDTPGEALSQTSGKTIWLRNQLLKMLLDVMCSDKLHLSSEAQEETFLALGPDWFLLFTQSHLHPSTVVLGVKLLLHFLHNPPLLSKFKEGVVAGRWVENSSTGLDLLMGNLKSGPSPPDYGPYLVFGLTVLKACLASHIHLPEIYLLVSGLFLGAPHCDPPEAVKGPQGTSMEGVSSSERAGALQTRGKGREDQGALRELRWAPAQPFAGPEGSWEAAYPGNVMQFLCLIYHSYPQDPVWCCSDFLQALASVVLPGDGGGAGSDDVSPLNGPAAIEANSCLDPPAAPLPLHPAKKQVWDFLRILLMESLLSMPVHKQGHPFELLLEASAENSTTEQKRRFQTEVLLAIMDLFHVISQRDGKPGASRPRGSSDPRGAAEVAVPTPVANVAYFTQKLVEQLYSGMFAAEPKQILLFVAEQIGLVLENPFPQKDTVISTLYSSLNRAILYCLSKPQQSLPEQRSLLNSLRVLQEQWDIIFATYNSNMSFTICLLHCLCQLSSGSYPEGFGVDAKPRLASYRQIFLAHSEEETGREDSLPAPSDVQQEILKTVDVTWRQLVSQRRQALEDTYKMDLSVKPGDRELKIAEITPLWEETMTKAWQHFIASEKKALHSKTSPAQSQSKHSSWSESLSSAMRLTPGRNIKEAVCKSEGFVSCMEKYRRSGQELYASLYKDHVQMLQCGYSKAAKDWARLEEQLFTRGGPWGAGLGRSAPRWVLDGYEGPARMRKRIRCERAHGAVMRMRSEDHSANRHGSTPIQEENQEELMLNGAERAMDCNQLTFFPALHESFHSEDFLELCVERQMILQEFVESEKVTCRSSVVLVQGHLAAEGVLLFGKEHFYLGEHFVLSQVDEVYCTKHCLSSITDPFIFNMCHKDPGMGDQACARYAYRDIKEIHPMRFLLQEIALEIFFKNGYSKFLVFHNSDRNKALKRFCSLQPVLKAKGITEESLNIRKNTGGEKTMLQKWQRREISNFDYLMYLNTLAGRTYNDYMQYPVFPWVLADYHSQALNLASPRTFRDLSKPMGAQTLERKRKFVQRYHEVEKSEGDPSAQCHYCTHYSSAIIVTSYLVRMEPFTQTFCTLQGGSFDVADRMFHSVKNAWDSASRDNMSDVRELIPEFFYLPEFLTNCNHFEFGSMQDGTVLGDVQLPPWADGDPYKFIGLHRKALESDYVSAHLHHWIDLIFGHKQHGSAAVEAVNTFHPYFYGDKVDLNSTSDPLIKSTILGFVSNFGQIPKQGYPQPHAVRTSRGRELPRGSALPLSGVGRHKQPKFLPLPHPARGGIRWPFLCSSGSGSPAGNMKHLSMSKELLAHPTNPARWIRSRTWPCCSTHRLRGQSGENAVTLECMADWGKCLCAACPTPTTVITSGTSAVVCVWELSLAKDQVQCLSLRQALYGHTQDVTCLAASVTYSIIVSGSMDRTCIVWDLNQLTHITCLSAHGAGLSAVAINESTGDIASCAGPCLHLWTVNGQPLARIDPTCGLEGAIICCCFAEGMQWDLRGVVITGGTDGMVRVWKTDYAKGSDSPIPGSGVPPKQRSTPARNELGQQLLLCRELNLGLALTGKPAKNNPAVTALAVARNSSRLLVGDERGRIYSWAVEG
uniref:WDFY family member 4 n=1 Tax=Pelodiscus sinensis TaxID=13735 RepID=K7GBL2_PELSI